ncbi:hypothetical protein D3C75_1155840 [compost metagenome]
MRKFVSEYVYLSALEAPQALRNDLHLGQASTYLMKGWKQSQTLLETYSIVRMLVDAPTARRLPLYQELV